MPLLLVPLLIPATAAAAAAAAPAAVPLPVPVAAFVVGEGCEICVLSGADKETRRGGVLG